MTQAFSATYIKLLDRATNEFLQWTKSEGNVQGCGGYGGSMMDDIEEIALTLQVSENMTVAEARRLFIKSSEVYLDRINSDEAMRPYLREYPFPPSRLDLGYIFPYRTGDVWNPSKPVAMIFQSKGSIVFYTFDPDQDRLVRLHKEPYDEALQIVKEEGYLDNIEYIQPKKKRSFFKKTRAHKDA